MNALEVYSKINETLSIIIWPVVVVVILLAFKKAIIAILGRAAGIEGQIGDVSFKVSLQKMMEEQVAEAVELKSQGKEEEALSVIKSTGEIAARLYGLTNSDIEELIALQNGEKPKRRWGKAHLVRAGLVELDGGKLTPQGKILVKKYLQPST